MDHHGGKIAAGLFSLVIVWITVFWLWSPADPKISFGRTDTVKEAGPLQDSPARPKLAPAIADPVKEPPPEIKQAQKPKAGGGVIAPEFTEYTVQAGETFASIAQKMLGSRSKADVIASANPLVDPTRLRTGRVIRIPKDAANIQGKPTARPPSVNAKPELSAAKRTHKVESGDTLTGISKKYCGTIKNISLILEANRNVLGRAEDLRPGQELVIPPAPQ